ncbi:hypothetical protein ACFQ9J_21030 [Streptomyces sp. NPDC056529]|uniref:hypothetical protein n=1 Tax=Streptomyces sp. NPDC056529 TaxID=3345855 RepID=UPI0036B96F45
MASRNDNAADAREELKRRLTEAKARREEALKKIDKLREDTEKEFWANVKANLDGAYHGARKDAAEVLDCERDHIYKQIKRYGV